MYYNKAIIEKAGINLKNPPKTWNEFLQVAKPPRQREISRERLGFLGL